MLVNADLISSEPRHIPKSYDFVSYLWYFFENKYVQSYKDRDEFANHFNSGEVAMPFADIEKLYRLYRGQKPEVLPSLFQKGDKVKFSINNKYRTDSNDFFAKVLAVHFFMDRVKYDLEIEIYDEPPTRIYNIDSKFVFPVEEEKEGTADKIKISDEQFPDVLIGSRFANTEGARL